MRYRRLAACAVGLMLIGALQTSWAEELYVRNRPFKGTVKKSDGRIWVDLKSFSQSLGATLVETPEGGVVVTLGGAATEPVAGAGKVVIGNEECESQPSPEGPLVPLDTAAKLLGARVSSNKGLGTIDVNIASAKSTKVSASTGTTAKAPDSPATGPIHKNINKGGSAVEVTDFLIPGRINIVDFYADWCGPCKALAPKLEAQSKNTKYAVLKVDIADWNSPVARKYQLQSIPHLKVYDGTGKLLAEGNEAYKYVK